MEFKVNDIVLYKSDPSDTYCDYGFITLIDDTVSPKIYWVHPWSNNLHQDESIPFTESDIMAWNGLKNDSCTCGASAVNHPGHSHWCDLSKTTVKGPYAY